MYPRKERSGEKCQNFGKDLSKSVIKTPRKYSDKEKERLLSTSQKERKLNKSKEVLAMERVPE